MVKQTTKQRGLSLTELLTVMAIVALLATIAYPSYTKYTRESRRSEAHAQMARIQAYLEQFYAKNNTYVGNDISSFNTTSFYSYAVNSATASAYSVEATATGGQVSDTACATMQLDGLGNRTPQECW